MEVARVYGICVARKCATSKPKLRIGKRNKHNRPPTRPWKKKRNVSFQTPYSCGGKDRGGKSSDAKESAGAPFGDVVRSFDREMWGIMDAYNKRGVMKRNDKRGFEEGESYSRNFMFRDDQDTGKDGTSNRYLKSEKWEKEEEAPDGGE